MIRRSGRAAVFGLAGFALACTTATRAPEPRWSEGPTSFALRPVDLKRRGAPPELLERLAAHPYTYFRALAEPFARRVCAEFFDRRWVLPDVLVHGDAHLEQFVVTADAFGLEDYDQVGTGPAVIDLVRFGSSIHLACWERDWPCDPNAAVDRLLDGYAVGLRSPDLEPRPPSIVARLRRDSAAETEAFLQWSESLMQPLSAREAAAVTRAWSVFVDFVGEVQPGTPAAAYRVERVGRLRIGVGSALDDKYLFRVRGPSAKPEDDRILEARRQAPPADIPCLANPAVGGMLRPLVAAARLGRRVPDTMAFVPVEPTAERRNHFWVQSWTPGYRELAVSDLESQAELDSLSFDAGLQLGSANARLSPEPLEAQLRWANLRALDLVAEDVPSLSAQLAAEVIAAWSDFR